MKSIVLLSAGLDSTVNFCVAHRKSEIVLALTFDYGQKAAGQEIFHARTICKHYKVPHKVIQLPWLQEITNTSLVSDSQRLPILNMSELDDFEKTSESAKKVWVPNRNGVMINIAASFAETLKASQIVVGFNVEEAKTFPDNSENYVKAVNGALKYSTCFRSAGLSSRAAGEGSQVQVVSYTQNLNKKEIVLLGREMKAPFDLMWSCYLSGQTPCGACESCLRFERAIASSQLLRGSFG